MNGDEQYLLPLAPQPFGPVAEPINRNTKFAEGCGCTDDDAFGNAGYLRVPVPDALPNGCGEAAVDRQGIVRYSARPIPAGFTFNLQAPTCQACHQYPAALRTSSRVIDTADGDILRTVVPFRNREECHRCHDPSHKINGIVIFDLDASGIRAAATRDTETCSGGWEWSRRSAWTSWGARWNSACATR